MSLTVTIAPVRKSVVVTVDAATAFEIFTHGLDRWWPRKLPADPRAAQGGSPSPVKESLIEPYVGGRWLSRCEDGFEAIIGRVLVWEPGRRVVFSWDFDAQWRPDANAGSEVEVTFIAEGPDTTRVELEHRNFERMGQAGGDKMRKDVEGGWPARLEIYARVAAGQSS